MVTKQYHAVLKGWFWDLCAKGGCTCEQRVPQGSQPFTCCSLPQHSETDQGLPVTATNFALNKIRLLFKIAQMSFFWVWRGGEGAWKKLENNIKNAVVLLLVQQLPVALFPTGMHLCHGLSPASSEHYPPMQQCAACSALSLFSCPTRELMGSELAASLYHKFTTNLRASPDCA